MKAHSDSKKNARQRERAFLPLIRAFQVYGLPHGNPTNPTTNTAAESALARGVHHPTFHATTPSFSMFDPRFDNSRPTRQVPTSNGAPSVDKIDNFMRNQRSKQIAQDLQILSDARRVIAKTQNPPPANEAHTVQLPLPGRQSAFSPQIGGPALQLQERSVEQDRRDTVDRATWYIRHQRPALALACLQASLRHTSGSSEQTPQPARIQRQHTSNAIAPNQTSFPTSWKGHYSNPDWSSRSSPSFPNAYTNARRYSTMLFQTDGTAAEGHQIDADQRANEEIAFSIETVNRGPLETAVQQDQHLRGHGLEGFPYRPSNPQTSFAASTFDNLEEEPTTTTTPVPACTDETPLINQSPAYDEESSSGSSYDEDEGEDEGEAYHSNGGNTDAPHFLHVVQATEHKPFGGSTPTLADDHHEMHRSTDDSSPVIIQAVPSWKISNYSSLSNWDGSQPDFSPGPTNRRAQNQARSHSSPTY
ncbi:hypothetical protein CVT26_008846 [Gymnopilus dilepis]|uniref:Uncharacterized protein n=1 Tax=Gymnopilus dilepis TaxID=231916 RepID=A0A409YGH0_9AGAR|nr:hypothetical protein CVT26_008846 [Gymnopilus dilepis]